ncbi:epoxide hydrolase [Solihabitans fulvus]|uniref:Epoxide hydrolase n=1 Tax=Solihabitans fulvus TaxID=1892852 RepID=A0A5B2XVS9_9PSEU|nr:epoxide hydrolase family protein [Solihabitans fulvus]KAA2267100.1 epoxide hydrolase [Solihabitans fulvus]
MTNPEIRPFRIDIPQADLDDLRDRIARTRWSGDIPGAGWSRGVPVAYLKGLADYWADGYDWRGAEARLNEFPQFTTEIDGQDIHFLHVRSPHADATPLLLLHEWPTSVVAFLDLIEPLTNPADPADAFHVVVPSLPGIAFSGPIREAGWTYGRTAGAFATLMERLGYASYGVQGAGGGAFIAADLGRQDTAHVLGIHVNALLAFPSGDPAEFAGLTEVEQERLARLQNFRDDMMGFAQIQSTRPQTVAYGLHDSPVGQLAWIVEKFKEWTDTGAELPEDAVDRDHILTTVSLYWFTGTAGSAAHLYYENAHDVNGWGPKDPGTVPTGVAVATPTDITVRRFADRDHNITHWTELERGGAFLSMEQPELLVEDVRTFFRSLR